jgi:hypothetical protein
MNFGELRGPVETHAEWPSAAAAGGEVKQAVAIAVGAATTVLGGALLAAPHTARPVLGLTDV